MATLDELVDSSLEKMSQMYTEEVVSKLMAALGKIGNIECDLLLYDNSSKLTTDIKNRCRSLEVFDYNIKNYLGFYAIGDKFRNYCYVGLVTTFTEVNGRCQTNKTVYIYGSNRKLGVL